MIRPTRMTRLVSVLTASALAAAVTSAAPRAHADDGLGQCIAASDRGIDLRKKGKLIDARKSFATCAADACGPEIKASCEKRITDVNTALPTIIFAPKTAAGSDAAGVKVSMVGAVLAESIDGRPFTLDPGRHHFTFELAGQAPVERDFVVNEKEKDRKETIVLGPIAPPPAPPLVVGPIAPAPAASPSSTTSPVRTIGYVVGGVGLAGVVVGSIFGVDAISKNNAAGCDAQSVCTNPQSRTAAQGSATISTAGFIAGGVLLAGGVVMILAAPKRAGGTAGATSWQWEAAPTIGSGGGGMLVRGTW